MRIKSELAGKTVKTKSSVGSSFMDGDLGGKEFRVEDWSENVFDDPKWLDIKGNPAIMEYAIRIGLNGKKNNVTIENADEAVYGKVGYLGHIFHINELEVE